MPPLESGAGTASLAPLWRLLPYLWPQGRRDLKIRVVLSIALLLLATAATGISPKFFGWAVDAFGHNPVDTALATVLALIGGYALSRILLQAFAQLRDGVFAKVQYHAVQETAAETFAHIHTLSLRFHLERKTGGLNRIIERGTRGIDTLLSFLLFNIFPTILLLIIYSWMLWRSLSGWIALTAIGMVALYTCFTFAITNWRIQYRRDMNDSDTDANTKAVDSLLNYETVKYFNNEAHETRRFDAAMQRFARASIQSQISLSVLNVGQAAIMAVGQGIILVLAALAVKQGRITVGAFVSANLIVIQLYQPLNLLGTVYRQIVQSVVDMEAMFQLLHQRQEVKDKPDARALAVTRGEIRFENVVFAYEPERTVLHGISFTVPAGKTVAVVGPSGAGKSTISRILYRFYDIASGSVTIDRQDIRDVTQDSLRAAIGIVPQDTVLFNDTVRYNIGYGRVGADSAALTRAAALARIDSFIGELPQGYDTMVGERGLKLSGGEKQRVAIARTILKDPPILLLDEATSALDTGTEREIQDALQDVSRGRTTLVIAHRLSTVIDADEILVLDHGRIIERGRHTDLIARDGIYAAMWNRQREAAAARDKLSQIEDAEQVR